MTKLFLLYSNKYFLLISTENNRANISSYSYLHAKYHNFRKSSDAFRYIFITIHMYVILKGLFMNIVPRSQRRSQLANEV